MVQTRLRLQVLRYESNISSLAELTLQRTQSGLQILGAAIACVAGVTDEEVSASQANTSSLM